MRRFGTAGTQGRVGTVEGRRRLGTAGDAWEARRSMNLHVRLPCGVHPTRFEW